MPAPDIFISYARADEDIARRYARAFADVGLSVWWDEELRSGEVFDQAIEAALRAAKAVVVLWSPSSVSSRWVRAEATLADRNKTMVPVTIEPCERPIIFELTHTVDLSAWDGDQTDKAWQSLVAELRRISGADAPAARPEAAPAAGTARGAHALEQQSVVVLPFANMSHDPEQEYFADGITEDIITDLSKVSALTIIARNTAFTFKDKHVDVCDVARRLNVTHVLEGSVRKAGNRVRVTAQLIDGGSGGHVWAERYDGELDDIFALQDQLSRSIVDALKLKLLPEEQKALETRGTDNIEAYDLYLRAKNAERQFAPQGAVAYAQAAVTLDPNFVDAWETLGILYIQQAVMMPETAGEVPAKADEAFKRAIALLGDSPRANFLEATRLQLIQRDWLQAEAAYAKIEGAYASSSVISAPDFLQGSGRMTELCDRFRERMRVDPLSSLPIFSFALDCLERYAEADVESDRMRQAEAAPYLIEYFTFLRRMARGDETAEIAQQLEKYLTYDDTYIPIHREVLKVLDDKPAIAQLVRRALDEDYYQDGPRMTGLSHLAGFSGDHELTLTCARKSFGDYRALTTIGLWHPLLAGARKLDGFKPILRDLGIVDFWRQSGNWGDFARPVGQDDFELIA